MTASNTEHDAIARMREALEQDDGSPPDLWNADDEEGAQLVGELIRYEERQTKIGVCQTAIVYDADDDETWSVFLTRSVLKNEFDKQRPRPGDTVGLKYHGRRKTRSGESEYHSYTLRVQRAPGSPAPAPAAPRPSAKAVDAEDDLDDLPF